MPNPTISAIGFAPRAKQRSSDSSTIMAPPSPRIIPVRSFEKGRHADGETTRIASQARRIPKLNGASLPPASASSHCPLRIIQNACPKACAELEQAVETV